MRGRNRPKGPNPLTRSYESNGPDVKIRGTPQHIADKYAQLARDAQAAGDPVAAENYFQHGEHYFRIISGSQEQGRQQIGIGYARQSFEDEDEGDEEGGQPGHGDQGHGYAANNGFNGDDYADPGQQPQPYERPDRRDRFQGRNDRPQRFDHQRGDHARQDHGRQGSPRHDQGRPDYGRPDQGRHEQPRDASRFDNQRGDQQRPDSPRPEFQRNDPPRQDHQRGDAPYRRDRRRDEPAQRPAADEASALPAFLMTTTRAPAPAEPSRQPVNGADRHEPDAVPAPADAVPAAKPRRRRRARFEGGEGADADRDFGSAADLPPASE